MKKGTVCKSIYKKSKLREREKKMSSASATEYDEIERRMGMEEELVEILKKMNEMRGESYETIAEYVEERREYLERYSWMEYAVMGSRYFMIEARREGIDAMRLPKSLKYDLKEIMYRLSRLDWKVEQEEIEVEAYVDKFTEIEELFTETMKRHGIYEADRGSRLQALILVCWLMKDRTREEHKMFGQMVHEIMKYAELYEYDASVVGQRDCYGREYDGEAKIWRV